jgi:hypothetical protein
MTGVFGFRIRYDDDDADLYVPFLPPSLSGAVEVEPVVFTAEPPFYVDDTFPATPVVRRKDSPEDVWWPLGKAIQLGLAATGKEWTSEVPG